jgi:hypothetical protein
LKDIVDSVTKTQIVITITNIVVGLRGLSRAISTSGVVAAARPSNLLRVIINDHGVGVGVGVLQC